MIEDPAQVAKNHTILGCDRVGLGHYGFYLEKGEGMEATVTLELTYLMVEVDGKQLVEIDKLNGVYKVNGKDMLAAIKNLT